MRLGFLVYSLTGNTRHVAEMVAAGLASRGLVVQPEVVFVDCVEVQRTCCSTGAADDDGGAGARLAAAVSGCDVVGLGCPSWAWRESPQFSQLLRRMPPGCLRGKHAFVFTTKGATQVVAHAVLAQLARRHLGARVVAQFSVLSVSNFAPACPALPLTQRWNRRHLEARVGEAVEKLVPVLTNPASLPEIFPDDTLDAEIAERVAVITKVMPFMTDVLNDSFVLSGTAKGMGPLAADQSLCIKCGKCIRACPNHAIQPGPDGFPVYSVEKCVGCSLCFQVCPKKAWYSPAIKNNSQWVFSEDKLRGDVEDLTLGRVVIDSTTNAVVPDPMADKLKMFFDTMGKWND
ncbi:hypothetical protein Pelo_10157 [Pelomyxa schiedti]|nr:hypothetical protein Pelo_10157 [Pelomyxa schiedti]